MSQNNTKKQIIDTIARLKKASVTDVIKNLPESRSRQWVSTLLIQLANEGSLFRAKSGKNVFYVLPDSLDLLGKKTSRRLKNQFLKNKEDIVFDEMKGKSPFFQKLTENVDSVIRYGFTEMLNNAIEHSQSKTIEVFVEELETKITFEVRDNGIGAFKNIMQKRKLASELEAIQDLLKGKTTTLPHSHTGEGIFFTSKIADLFVLDSFEYRLRVDNIIKDIFVEKIDSFTGTRVRFEIDKKSQKHLNDIFIEYAAEPGSYAFDKTKVHVKLYKAGTVYISRSQARRLMVNLDKFRMIILDFSNIETVGQAFADEIFRVFMNLHPDIKIEPVNMVDTVEFMINRAINYQ